MQALASDATSGRNSYQVAAVFNSSHVMHCLRQRLTTRTCSQENIV